MTARKLIAAAILIVAGSAYAADAPVAAGANAAVAAGATAAATATVATTNTNGLNFPVLKNEAARSRESVRAEAIEAVRNHKTTLAQQLEIASK